MKKMLLLAASAAMLAMPLAGPAAAAEPEFCEVTVYINEYPGVSTNPISVNTGDYDVYTDCWQDPPITIHPIGICTYKPPICI